MPAPAIHYYSKLLGTDDGDIFEQVCADVETYAQAVRQFRPVVGVETEFPTAVYRFNLFVCIAYEGEPLTAEERETATAALTARL